jgi:hypothetical protein
MVVYPYRQPNGYRSILEAVDRDDARQWLKGCAGHGVRFCEVDMDIATLHETQLAQDSDTRIENLLATHRIFVT